MAGLLPSSFIYVGRAPLGDTPIVSSRVWRLSPRFTPPVIFTQCLGEALRGSHHRHHAIVLTKLPLDPLLDQEFQGRHRAERVLNSEVSYVRYLLGWIVKMFDYINHVNLTLLLSVY